MAVRSARLVAHVEVGEPEIPAFGDAAHGAFKGVPGGGDAAVVLGFGLAAGFQDGDDNTNEVRMGALILESPNCANFRLMYVESDVECRRCACVRFHSFHFV